MTAHDRPDAGARLEELSLSHDEDVAPLRREVGRRARTMWNALQRTLKSFGRTKGAIDPKTRLETGKACALTLTEIDHLRAALVALCEALPGAPATAAPRLRRSSDVRITEPSA